MPNAPGLTGYEKLGTFLVGISTYFCIVSAVVLALVTWFPTSVVWEGARAVSTVGMISLALMLGGKKLAMGIWKLRVRRVMRINKRIQDAQRGLDDLHEQANEMNILRDRVPADARQMAHTRVADIVAGGWGTMEEAVVGDYIMVTKVRDDYDGTYVDLPEDDHHVARVTGVVPGEAHGRVIDAMGTRGLPVRWVRIELRQLIGRLGDHTHIVVGTVIYVGGDPYRIRAVDHEGQQVTLEPVNEPPDRIIKRTLHLQGDFKIVGVEDGRLVRRPNGMHTVLTKDEPILNQGENNVEAQVQEGQQAHGVTDHGTFQQNAETEAPLGGKYYPRLGRF